MSIAIPQSRRRADRRASSWSSIDAQARARERAPTHKHNHNHDHKHRSLRTGTCSVCFLSWGTTVEPMPSTSVLVCEVIGEPSNQKTAEPKFKNFFTAWVVSRMFLILKRACAVICSEASTCQVDVSTGRSCQNSDITCFLAASESKIDEAYSSAAAETDSRALGPAKQQDAMGNDVATVRISVVSLGRNWLDFVQPPQKEHDL